MDFRFVVLKINFYNPHPSPPHPSIIASCPRTSFMPRSGACSPRILISTASISSRLSTDTRDFRYSLTHANPWRYWTRCLRLSRIPFRHLHSTRSFPCSCMIVRISARVGIYPLGRKHQGLPKLARPIINPSRFPSEWRTSCLFFRSSFAVLFQYVSFWCSECT